ncbi:hypothetical protein [uncultured Anaerococcus sp.]|uniref:hypothetical protein n=1 Tax=uncultured Anaerococcus sp. TaxID=293428 RepID=UPI00288B8625|nr:hypothetical protein [uncultured Anaerococcus sp.]
MKKIFKILALILILTACNSQGKVKNPATQEYIVGTGNIKGNVDVDKYLKIDQRFEIGADKNGMAVFKDPHKAYQALTEKYTDGINLIQKEFDLEDLSETTYQAYKIYGGQVETGTPEEKDQANFVSRFFDIYENSFE